MVKEVKKTGKIRYACEECGYIYAQKEWAERCEAWCREHHSCNPEILRHGTPPEEPD